MKRFGHLYPQIYAFDNLLLAYRKARKGKRNKTTVARFEVNMEYELLQLQQELQMEQYQPGAYTTFMIYDPKKRMISAAPFRDRVVHHSEKLESQLNSWKGHAQQADTWQLQNNIFNRLNQQGIGLFKKQNTWKILY